MSLLSALGRRPAACEHAALIREVDPSSPDGCTDCLAIGDRWVHLRICLVCGRVGCCDNSPNRHATKHFHETGHPVIQSFEPGERWRFCYVDKVYLPKGEPFRTAGGSSGGSPGGSPDRSPGSPPDRPPGGSPDRPPGRSPGSPPGEDRLTHPGARPGPAKPPRT